MDGSTPDGMTEPMPKDLERLAEGEGTHDAENFEAVLEALKDRGAVSLEYSASPPVEIATHEDGYLVASNVDGEQNRYLTDSFDSNLIVHTMFAASIEPTDQEDTRLYHSADQRAGLHFRSVEDDE